VVAREDADKQELQKKLEESQRMVSTIEKTLIGFQHDLTAMRNALDSFGRQVEVRALQQDKEIAELRVEMKEQLQQLEHRLRSEMQRLVPTPSSRRAKT
jgi:predicted  nucleic acid-binding Zn-ribbon protein